MAESVDALVSNTCGRKAVPVRPRLWVQSLPEKSGGLCCFYGFSVPWYLFQDGKISGYLYIFVSNQIRLSDISQNPYTIVIAL